MRMPDPEFIASHALLRRGESGEQAEINIQIGRPYPADGAWACALVVDERYPDIYGDTSLQALCLAVSLASRRLREMLKAGEILSHPDSPEVRLDAEALDALFGSNLFK
ncbi:hypothetical protein [Massilia sp. erpn]|uniref:hypothetical protein n=1 Tax=Massilia sp. erpn TaxID=2738142 RepID=UPI0021040602|nr:hypothetical protein [Massilia sp. erpn]UTY59971.1 hypothetical protein HPQ68_23945 [Massilia sp. erpn]